MSAPFIWSVIQFDANGNLIPLVQGTTSQIYPSYMVYRNGGQLQTIDQGPLENFISLDWTSFYVVP